MATSLRQLMAALLLCTPVLACGESLPDPTLPAIDLNGNGTEAASIETTPRGLQSTIISPQYRAAIINGETVTLGGQYGDSKLVEVRESSVVLQNSRGRRVLELFPKVNIKNNGAATGKRGDRPNADGQPDLPEKDAGGSK